MKRRLGVLLGVCAALPTLVCVNAQATPVKIFDHIGQFSNDLAMNSNGDYIVAEPSDGAKAKSMVAIGNVNAPVPSTIQLPTSRINEEFLTGISENATRFVVWTQCQSPRSDSCWMSVARFSPGAVAPEISKLKFPCASCFDTSPDLVVGPRGDAMILAVLSIRHRRRLIAAMQPAGATLTRFKTILTARSNSAIATTVANFDANGIPTIVISQTGRGSRRCRSRDFRQCYAGAPTVGTLNGSGLGGFGRLQWIKNANYCRADDFAEEASGAAVLPMVCSLGLGAPSDIRVTTRAAGGRFEKASRISSKSTPLNDGLTSMIAPDGSTYLAWTAARRASPKRFFSSRLERIVVAKGTIGGPFTPPNTVSTLMRNDRWPEPGGAFARLLRGTGGEPFLLGAIGSKPTNRLAPLSPDLKLGQEVTIDENLTSLAISNSGVVLKTWLQSDQSGYKFSLMSDTFPAPSL